MIKIIYDECGSTININVEAGGESGSMKIRDMVLHIVGIVGGIGAFIRSEIGENTMNAFFDAIRELDNTELLDMFECGGNEKTNNEG